MKRNRDRYDYVELSLLKSSAVYQLLAAEADTSGQSLAQAILTRVALSYGLLAPVPPMVQHSSLTPEPKSQKPERGEQEQEQKETPTFDMDAALKNADLFGL